MDCESVERVANDFSKVPLQSAFSDSMSDLPPQAAQNYRRSVPFPESCSAINDVDGQFHFAPTSAR
jgi:hypothetical protein